MPTRTASPKAKRVQEVRDLRGQITGIEQEEQAEIVLQESSPPRRRHPLFSVLTGEEVMVLEKRLERVLSQTLPDGRFEFTSEPEEAPEFKRGEIKCIFHPESPEHAILEEIGLSGISCPAEHLKTMRSRRVHAENRHGMSYAAYREYLQERKDGAQADRMAEQTEAIRELGRAAVAQKAPEPEPPPPEPPPPEPPKKGKADD